MIVINKIRKRLAKIEQHMNFNRIRKYFALLSFYCTLGEIVLSAANKTPKNIANNCMQHY